MNGTRLSDFGLAVKIALIKRGKSQSWLEKEVAQRTGLFVDGGYMYKILTGQRNAPKVVAAINEILGLN